MGIQNETDSLWMRYRETRDVGDRNALVLAHLSYVNKPVREIYPVCRSTNEFDDIYQSAVIGLIDAVESFDPENGASFRTFSRYRIHGAIIDYLRKSNLFTVSYNARKNDPLREFGGRTRLEPRLTPLDELNKNDENIDYIFNLLVDLSENVEEKVTDSVITEEIIKIMKRLPIDEYTVMVQYYFNEKSLGEIADKLGYSKSGVWQMRSRAIRKIRAALEKPKPREEQ